MPKNIVAVAVVVGAEEASYHTNKQYSTLSEISFFGKKIVEP